MGKVKRKWLYEIKKFFGDEIAGNLKKNDELIYYSIRN